MSADVIRADEEGWNKNWAFKLHIIDPQSLLVDSLGCPLVVCKLTSFDQGFRKLSLFII